MRDRKTLTPTHQLTTLLLKIMEVINPASTDDFPVAHKLKRSHDENTMCCNKVLICFSNQISESRNKPSIQCRAHANKMTLY